MLIKTKPLNSSELLTMKTLKTLSRYEYSILEFLFYCRVDLSFFMRDNLEEKANLILPDGKEELMALLNRLKNLDMLIIKDIHKENRANDIVYDKNMKKGIYSIEISKKAGDTIAKIQNKSWSSYCDYEIESLANSNLKVKIYLHINRLNEILKILDTINIDYKVSDLEYWYPLYWKKLKGGKIVEMLVSSSLYDSKLDFILDEMCRMP